MRLSRNTIAVLNNFAKINDSLTFEKGSRLLTLDRSRGLLAEAILDDEFPQDGAIYSLKELLSQIRKLSSPLDLRFADFASRLNLTLALSDIDAIRQVFTILPPSRGTHLPLRDIADDLIRRNASVIDSRITLEDHFGGTRARGTITIQENGGKGRTATVYACDPTYVRAVPKICLPPIINPLTFDLCATDLTGLKRKGKKKTTALKLHFDGKMIRLQKFGSSKKRPLLEDWVPQEELMVGVGYGMPFESWFAVDCSLYMMAGSYRVEVQNPLCQNAKNTQSITHFQFKGFPLNYWVGLGSAPK